MSCQSGSDSPPSATQKRAEHPLFASTWSLEALAGRLPLLFPADDALPPSPKKHYRSQYAYQGAAPLQEAAQRAAMSDWEISLHLIDFAPLERVLAQSYRPSCKGQVPFHPVSMFLACCLRRELQLSWGKVACLLAGAHGAHWRALLGFQAQCTPSCSGLRMFYQTIPLSLWADFCPRCMQLLREQGLAPTRSTYPGDPPTRGVTCSEDGMLHPARQQDCCQLATDDCYRPLAESASVPQTPSRRPCRAREHGLEGCACNTPACQSHCRQASTLDAQARLVHYSGDNKHAPERAPLAEPTDDAPGITVFGYRSVADLLLDDRWAVAWVLQSTLLPANTSESSGFADRLTALRQRFPDLQLGEWLGDAALGYPDCLDAVRNAGAWRMIDTRADPHDSDPQVCLRRGYNEEGHPLCPHGYLLSYQGYDHRRRRAKWACRQVCRRHPLTEGGQIQPVPGCPYLQKERPMGQVINVGRALPDGCVRLAREIPYHSLTWKARYGRRNLSESRNSQLQGLGLKRLPCYGLERNTREVQLADFLINLHTLGRLVREASNLQPAPLGP